MSKIGYPVMFNAGLHGTWLTWFINQHSNFVQSKVLIRNTINGIVTDYGIRDGWWHTQQEDPTDLKYEDSHKLFTFSEYIKDCQNCRKWSNPYADKVALKLFPHHIAWQFKNTCGSILQECNAKITIIPYMNEVLANEISARYNIIRPNSNINFIVTKELVLEQCGFIEEWTNIYLVDIGKLITKDKNEYHKLCLAIDEKPIPQWKELCDIVLNEIYENIKEKQ